MTGEPSPCHLARIYHHLFKMIVEDKTGSAARSTPQVAHLGVIYRHGGKIAAAAEVGRQQCRLVKIALCRWTGAVLEDDVTSRQALRMQPGIAPGGDLKGQVIVLAVVLANEDLLTRRGLERKGPWRLFGAFSFYPFGEVSYPASTSSSRISSSELWSPCSIVKSSSWQ